MSDDRLSGHWQDDNKAIQKKLLVMKSEGIQTITWHTWPGACDPCTLNNGQTVRVGRQFASGASIPPNHNHCNCLWTDDKGRTYEWTGEDGMYQAYQGKMSPKE